MRIELHCHSLYSVDGWAAPERLAEAAAAAGVQLLALTDHNTVEGLSRCRERAEALGLRVLPGVEFDAAWRNLELHLLTFGFDAAQPGMRRLCARSFAQYALNFERFLPILERRFGVTRAALAAGLERRYATHPQPVLNKWFAREFLLTQGVFPDADTAAREMVAVAAEAERDVARPWDWPATDEVVRTVHDAGGRVLLAHVANYCRGDLHGQIELLTNLLEQGLDGIELYHPANLREPHFAALAATVRRLGCAVSGGTDTHMDPCRLDPPVLGMEVPDWAAESLSRLLSPP
jgi:predicted metal-dependent phosphoesterase TrpH